MESKKLLIRLVSLIVVIFLLNYMAMNFFWYTSIWYLDMPMHFLGGFWLGLAVIWFLKIKEITPVMILKIVLAVLIIGILWEVFEIIVNRTITENSFNTLDTFSDLFFDIAGGISSTFYLTRHTFPTKENIT